MGLFTWNDIVARCGSPSLSGLNETLRKADWVQAPPQVLRPASRPSCFSRQRRASPEAFSMSDRIDAASAGSAVVAGSATKARSLFSPSPLTSPPTSGVYGLPERMLPNQLTRTASKKL